MIKALVTLHRVCEIAHLDLKPENIVIKDDYTLAFIDFCLSKSISETTSYPTGTKRYYPPEMHYNFNSTGNYTFSEVDIFHFGMIMF